MKFRKPDSIIIIAKDDNTADTVCEITEGNDYADIYVTSCNKLKWIKLRWDLKDNEKRSEKVKVHGDAWERSYGDLCWDEINKDRYMPWYMAVSNGSDSVRDFNGRKTECFGVGVQAGAFCSWQYDNDCVTLNLDIRNLGAPVELNGRKLHVARVYFREYLNCSAFDALCEFCKVMSPAPLKTDKIIYGSNNWYYAYGKSSREEILTDCKIVAELCKENKNTPFMVIDDGWQINNVQAPWTSRESFGNMKTLADEMSSIGVIPGIWVRFLTDEKFALDMPDEARTRPDKTRLDPTHPATKEFIKKTINDINSWGYKLIKHDFSSEDIAGRWGFKMTNGEIVPDSEGFYDKSKTTAEVVVEFYKLIKETAGETIILGCNCFSHLCAGLHEIYRTGDDTSGREWERTRKMGVNTLAFRLCQNNSFYIVDADCVGITGLIDFRLNGQWLDLVAKSGTSLFVSCKPSEAKGEVKSALEEGFKPASTQQNKLIPLDWMENITPCEYLVDGEYKKFNWQ